MSKWDKLLERIISLPNYVRFEELKRILETYGYTMSTPRGGSSHCTFRKKGFDPITIPRHRQIKKVYVELVKNLIEENLKDENSR